MGMWASYDPIELGPKNADFGPKIQLFWYHVTPIFGLRWTQLNRIITCPHHEVTLDNFGFLVGAHSTAWWAVIRPFMAKMVLLGAKMHFFGQKTIFWRRHPNFLMPSW